MPGSNQQKFFDDIVRWQQSGLSQKAWCTQHGIAYSSFHYWYRRFRMQHTEDNADAAGGFVQLNVRERSADTPWCELMLQDGHKLCFYQPVAASFIRSLLP